MRSLIAFTLAACLNPCAAQTPIDSTRLAALVDSVVAAGLTREKIPGAAVIVVQNGRIVLARGYGPFEPGRTLFPIASITKVVTATALVQLIDRGRVDLQADVNRYLRSAQVPRTYPAPVTVAHLLTHASGLDELPGRLVRTAGELKPLGAFLRTRLVPVHPAGALTSYSSYGMALAGLLVEEVSGQSFETYLRRNVFDPAGMTRTFISVPPALQGDLATAYERDGDSLVAIPYELYNTPGASSVVSNLPDMARFMIVHLQRGRGTVGGARILSDSAAALMQRQHATMHPLVPGWALGWQVDDANGRFILEHGGDIGGFSALLTLLPNENVGIFTVHHLEGSGLRFDVKRAVLDRFFPDRRPVVVPRPDSASRVDRYAGTYRASTYCHSCPGGGRNVQDFEVTANDDGTITVWDDRWVEVSPRYFLRVEGGRRGIGFAEDASGRITALTAGSWRVLERLR
jgi:CubicO group peptidase (beta-lactamase class C family)